MDGGVSTRGVHAHRPSRRMCATVGDQHRTRPQLRPSVARRRVRRGSRQRRPDLHRCIRRQGPCDTSATKRQRPQPPTTAAATGPTPAQVNLDQTLAHLRVVVDAVAVPVNADFKDGYAVEPEGVKANVTSAVATGIAGLSIEDSTGDEADPLFDLELAVERIRAAREAIDESGTGVVLTGRSEGFVCGRPTSTRRSVGFARTRRRVPTACTPRGSTTSIMSSRSWARCHRSP